MIRRNEAVLSIAFMLGGCSTLDLPFTSQRDADFEVQNVALAEQQAKTLQLSQMVDELREENARLVDIVAELKREKQRVANRAEISSQIAADQKAADEVRAATQNADILIVPAPPKNPETIIVAEAEARPLTASAITVEATPRLVEPSFVAAETVFENEATGSNIETSSVLFGVHLASYHKTDEVIVGWKELQTKYPGLLGLLEPRVEEVEIEGRGIFQRLIAGGFSSEETAADLCDDLKRKKLYCVVTGFNGKRLVAPAAG